MTKILILNEPENINGVTWWRMYRPLLLLEQLYPDNIKLLWNRGVILPVNLMQADVAICFRPSEPVQISVLSQIRSMDIPIICDFDDDLKNITSGSPAYNQLGHKWPLVEQALRLANMVWVSTPALSELYATNNTHIVPNSILESDLPNEPNPITKTVVWRGDFSNIEDLTAFKPVFDRILKRCNHFVWCGYMPTWKFPEHGASISFMPWTSLHEYFKKLTKLRPNYIWKPLRSEQQFNHGKSNIAMLEALMVGGVACTNFAGKPGWEAALPDSIWKEYPYQNAFYNARKIALAEYNLVDHTHQRFKLIQSLA